MAKFIDAYHHTAPNEGGYTDNPADRGNYVDGLLIGTNKGVSAPVLKEWLGRRPTVQEMKALDTATAQAIYKKNYWNVIRGDEWHDQNKANHVYDMAVNAGCSAAVKLWQVAIGVPPTGHVDNITLQKTNLL